MNLQLEFSDSEVAAVVSAPGGLCIRFSAACVVRAAEADRVATPGFARNVELLLRGARSTALLPELLGRVAQGRLSLAGHWCGSVPLPGAATAPVELELNFANGSVLSAQGSGFESRFVAEPNFAESLFC